MCVENNSRDLNHNSPSKEIQPISLYYENLKHKYYSKERRFKYYIIDINSGDFEMAHQY